MSDITASGIPHSQMEFGGNLENQFIATIYTCQTGLYVAITSKTTSGSFVKEHFAVKDLMEGAKLIAEKAVNQHYNSLSPDEQERFEHPVIFYNP